MVGNDWVQEVGDDDGEDIDDDRVVGGLAGRCGQVGGRDQQRGRLFRDSSADPGAALSSLNVDGRRHYAFVWFSFEYKLCFDCFFFAPRGISFPHKCKYRRFQVLEPWSTVKEASSLLGRGRCV